MINTAQMHDEDFASSIPAEACTELGFEDDLSGDGGMIGRLILLAVVVSAVLVVIL